MLSSIPLLAIAVVLYNLIALFDPGAVAGHFLTVRLMSGAIWTSTVGDLLVALGLIFLYIEVVKATRFRSNSTIDHILSLLLLIVCLLEFIALPAFGTSTFFLLLLMAVVDVLAGFTVGVQTARRDIGFDPTR